MPGMPRASLACRLAAVSAIGLGTGGCTVVKPVVGAVYGPVVLLAASDGALGASCADGRGVLIVFAIFAAIGATGGLVTGVISDVQFLCGDVEEPTRHWAHPFKTNTSPVDDDAH